MISSVFIMYFKLLLATLCIGWQAVKLNLMATPTINLLYHHRRHRRLHPCRHHHHHNQITIVIKHALIVLS